MKIIGLWKSIQKSLKKHSPEILTGIGISGMVVATVSAVRVTPKALRLIDECEKNEDKRLNKKEIVITTWKCYVPSAVIGLVSIVCLVGATSVHLQRNTALAAAYSLSETMLKEYQQKAVEVVGEKKERTIRDAVAKEQIEKRPMGKREVVITGNGEVLCYEPLSGRYFKSNKEAIDKAINELDRQMRYEMTVTLNDFYDAIGLAHTTLGDDLGWDIDKDYIELDYSTQLVEDGTPCLVLGQYHPPTYFFR